MASDSRAKISDPIRRLYVLRHGEVAYFDEKGRILDAWTACLTDRGRCQIGNLAERLAGCGVDRLVTSTLPRALESAVILAGYLGLAPIEDEAWNELRPGDLSIVPEGDLRRVIIDAYRVATAPDARFFGGELFANFAERVDRGLLAIVTHDPVARYLLSKALGLGLAGLPFFEQDAGCLNVIDWAGDAGDSPHPIIRLVNGTVDDPVKTGSRDPTLMRFYESYVAFQTGAS